MQGKKISVIIPVYNGEKYLAQAIDSVLNQTYKNIELIVVNDCSTDNTRNIVETFMRNDPRIKLIDNPQNYKLPKSLNAGFKLATGEYYTWTLDDNFYDLQAFQKMYDFLEKKPSYICVYADFEKIFEGINGKNHILKLDVSPSIMIYGNCVGACFLYKKEAADKIGGYDETAFWAEDYDYWLKMMLEGEIGHIPECLYYYRLHPNSLTTTRVKAVSEITQKLQEKYMPMCLNKFSKVRKEENKRIKEKNDYLEKYKLSKKWIEKYTIERKGIAVESNQPQIIYPEVTGYYIPTLLNWGDRKRAVDFGNYLLTIQNPDGSWNDPSGKMPYTFDTGQILKGLMALIESNLDKDEKYKTALLRGCDWIISQQRENGSIATPDYSGWMLPYEKVIPEAVHIYCLEVLQKASSIYEIDRYKVCVQQALSFYLAQEDLCEFNTLSHFNAYIIEGLIDIGEIEHAKHAMGEIALYQRADGSLPGYSNVDFVCSTGLFQYAICWYKLGELERANRAFDYAVNLQTKTGGFFGSYGKNANYFPQGEIAWAVKYFFDAIYIGQKANYEKIANIFLDNIDNDDERYLVIEDELQSPRYTKVLDLGCGKGRYTKRLIQKYPEKKFYCVDISSKVMEYIEADVEKQVGSILNIPYGDGTFDFVFIAEALEHAIDIESAIGEISRVLNSGGVCVVIDKDRKYLGQLELAKFEQWFDVKELCDIFKSNGFDVTVKTNLKYENKKNNLFNAWIGMKNK